MAFWLTGDEDHEDKRFDTAPGGIPAGLGLYTAAGSWCFSKVKHRRYDKIPLEWFIPDEWVNGQCNGSKIAKGLVRNGLWERINGGYRFAWIRKQNLPETVQKHRAGDRHRHAKQPGFMA